LTETHSPRPETPLVFDGHNDVVLSLYNPERGHGRSFFERSSYGHLDLPRAREGGFCGGFFAVFVPADPSAPTPEEPEAVRAPDGYARRLAAPLSLAYAQRVATALTATLFRLERESGGQLRFVRDAAELQTCLDRGVLAGVLHYEGAEAIDPDLYALEVLHRAGLRSLGLVWSRPNAFAHGVPFRFPHGPDTGPGLTDAGRELVRACNRLRVMVDLSHLNERGFWDVARLTDAPLVATHSNAHSLCPTTRNLTDRQLDAIRESDGMVGVNFAVAFLRPDGRDDADTPLEVVARHVEYLVERVGLERVGFGSDFDGARMPSELDDAAGLPRLLRHLRGRGYDDDALRKLAHGNWLRVLRKTWGA
jgi:membrane dipeptidase